ncbi:MAG: hypothetical protein OEZ44_11480 [Candidatus Bathyarchaeota archaeon]|nr:hypothetical protein [Candidatus Bathyarchaeota archaeon]
MTSITLPLKKIPGQTPRLPTFFGGRTAMAPLILLLTIPFTLYLYYRLSQGILLLYNLIGLLPYFWGFISIIDYINKSNCVMEKLIEADLDEAEKVHETFKEYFRRVVVSNGFNSIILITVFYWFILAYGGTSIYIIGISSITSTGLALASTMTGYDAKTVLASICLVCAFEAAFLIMSLSGLLELNLIFPVASLIIVYTFLRRVEGYDLRSFFERVIN